MSGDRPPVRGRAAIAEHYAGSGGPLALRALAFSTDGALGYILGGFARRAGEATSASSRSRCGAAPTDAG